MRTLDIEIAIMQYLNPMRNLIVPNASWGVRLHECDLLSLSKSGYATEIEIKISKSDLLKDKIKKHNHLSNYIKKLYFAVPEKLKEIALKEIPERAGLIIIKNNYKDYINRYGCAWKYIEVIRECKINKNAISWHISHKFQLARLGAIRILGLKKKIYEKETNR
jgi:hypothetical protein